MVLLINIVIILRGRIMYRFFLVVNCEEVFIEKFWVSGLELERERKYKEIKREGGKGGKKRRMDRTKGGREKKRRNGVMEGGRKEEGKKKI